MYLFWTGIQENPLVFFKQKKGIVQRFSQFTTILKAVQCLNEENGIHANLER